MSTKQCEVCGEYLWEWKLPHRCKPHFEVCLTEWSKDRSDWVDVYANDYEEAAEKCCEQDDSYGDYTIIKHGFTNGVLVRKFGDDLIKEFEVSAEMIPQYHALEKCSKESGTHNG